MPSNNESTRNFFLNTFGLNAPIRSFSKNSFGRTLEFFTENMIIQFLSISKTDEKNNTFQKIHLKITG